MCKRCFCAIHTLQKNDDITITKSVKESSVVLLSRSHYVDKTNKILKDPLKFERLGQVSSNHNTVNIESCLQKQLSDLLKVDLKLKRTYDARRLPGLQRPPMHGLPKTHEEGNPIHPILSRQLCPHH